MYVQDKSWKTDIILDFLRSSLKVMLRHTLQSMSALTNGCRIYFYSRIEPLPRIIGDKNNSEKSNLQLVKE